MVAASTSRREFLKLLAGTGVASGALADAAFASAAAGTAVAHLEDSALRLEFDEKMRLRVWRIGTDPALTAWHPADSLLLADGTRLQEFTLQHQEARATENPPGRALLLSGVAGTDAARLEKRVRIALYPAHPGFALCQVSYRNLSKQPLTLRGWRTAGLQLLGTSAEEPQFWSYCGSTHADRRDWVQPVKAGFAQENYMGMTASDYGGGTPIVDVWRRD